MSKTKRNGPKLPKKLPEGMERKTGTDKGTGASYTYVQVSEDAAGLKVLTDKYGDDGIADVVRTMVNPFLKAHQKQIQIAPRKLGKDAAEIAEADARAFDFLPAAKKVKTAREILMEETAALTAQLSDEELAALVSQVRSKK